MDLIKNRKRVWPLMALVLTACVATEQHKAPMAHAKLQAAESQTVAGMVMLHQMDGHVMLHAKVTGLKPNSEHGFHIHDKGDCSKADFTSAGGHFNPSQQAHGTQTGEHHVGDMPNLKADGAGNVEVKLMLHTVSLTPGAPNNVIGRAVIIHANPDDYQSQPAGNSGPRIACGVIEGMMMHKGSGSH